MRLKFHQITWSNLNATGAHPIRMSLDSHKTTLLIGENGAGKSTIMDALCFALFGKPYRKVNKGEIINTLNGKGLVTEVEFTANGHLWKIVRGMKPTIFDVYKNGEVLPSEAAMKDMQAYLETHVLRMSYKTFCQVVILGKSFVPFMQLTAVDRRSVIEDILDIGIFSDMAKAIKEDLSGIREDQSDNNNEISRLEIKVEAKQDLIDRLSSIERDRETKLSAIRKEIAENKTLLAKTKEARANLGESLSERDDLSSRLTTRKTSVIAMRKQQSSMFADIQNMKKDAVCPTCGQAIDKDTLTHNKAQKDLQKKYDELSFQIEKETNELENLKIKLQMTDHLVEKEAAYTSDIMNLSATIRQAEKQVSTLEGPTFDSVKEESELATMKKSLSKLHKVSKQIGEMLDLYTAASKLLKDDAIKAYIISHYIPIINEKTNEYLSHLALPIGFKMDETFEEKIYARGADELKYNAFSEGEKGRIDLALLFAWKAIAAAKNSISTNLLFLDEILDASMDEAGCSAFLSKLLSELSTDSNVFVISHRGDSVLDKFERVLKFSKKSAFSTLEGLKV